MKRTQSGILLAISVIALARLEAAETIFFLVGDLPGEPRRNESFVLPLSKMEEIDYARYLISRSMSGFIEGDRTIVVANVVAAWDDTNRNFLDPKFPQWSWQVAQFVNFAEIIAEAIETSPTLLEQFDWHSSSTGSRLAGFTGLYVTRELGRNPLYLSIVAENQHVQFYWSGAGTNRVYTLECNESLGSTNWLAVPGASWPLQTNHWTLLATNTAALFYRVRVDRVDQPPR